MPVQILLVEDEQPIQEMVAFTLRRAGMECWLAGDAREADVVIAERVPDLILLDWMLPEVSGIEYARRLRNDDLTREIPVIILTARAGEDDRVYGLESGADDYVVKPFSPRELVARVRAVLRRSQSIREDDVLEFDGLRMDLRSHRVFGNETPIALGPTEFKLLQFFMAHADRVYTRSQLLDHVWGRHAPVDERTVDVHIRRLRKALEPFELARLVQTVRGVGYRFSPEVSL